jgi:hypothetical protein
VYKQLDVNRNGGSIVILHCKKFGLAIDQKYPNKTQIKIMTFQVLLQRSKKNSAVKVFKKLNLKMKNVLNIKLLGFSSLGYFVQKCACFNLYIN